MLYYLSRRPFLIGRFKQIRDHLAQPLSKKQPTQIILPCSLNDLSLAEGTIIYDQVDICTTDSMWLTWWIRFKTGKKIERVYGPDLMESILNLSANSKLSKHYFLAADQLVAKKLQTWIQDECSQLDFTIDVLPHHISAQEEESYLTKVLEVDSNIVWLGVGSPKQLELANWLKVNSSGLKVFCVGAAFDFITGNKEQAPNWMKHSGLEWLFRLLTEPRRLWRRYLVIVPRYLLRILFKKL